MNNSNYQKGVSYAIFIGRAFNDHTRSKKGSHETTFTNLIDAENRQSNSKDLESIKKMMERVKKYMLKAMDKYLVNKKIPQSNRSTIEALKNQIYNCNHSTQLLEIIKRTDELTEVLDNN